MPRDPRTYITVHDGMPDHPKIEGLSDAAFRLLVTCWCWCSKNRTDGHIKQSSWSKRGTARARKELIDEGLVEATDTGVVMHDYLEHQRSAAEVDDLSRKRAEAGRKGGAKSGQTRSAAPTKSRSKSKASASPSAQQTGTKTEADTDTEKTEPNGSGAPHPPADVEEAPSRNAGTLVAEWIEHCRRRPPNNVIGQISKHCRALLEEGIDYDDVRSGLQAWWQRGDLHPSVLPSLVNEVINGGTSRRGTGYGARQTETDDFFARAAERAAALDAQTGTDPSDPRSPLAVVR
ncbi:hypothetical protein [Auraticoccus monumenti]|uniref:Uncharacterized protein n=1 Tax=Auraticoccus monumenti TaxID=675864 RepID=A0A1G6UPS8_9ACTN|nr:hypothetical protein [Auraticoccus monumenti]SDD42706.1 hypothetical protein SAMN04489747_0925 [Auraticoccus monumenti]